MADLTIAPLPKEEEEKVLISLEYLPLEIVLHILSFLDQDHPIYTKRTKTSIARAITVWNLDPCITRSLCVCLTDVHDKHLECLAHIHKCKCDCMCARHSRTTCKASEHTCVCDRIYPTKLDKCRSSQHVCICSEANAWDNRYCRSSEHRCICNEENPCTCSKWVSECECDDESPKWAKYCRGSKHPCVCAKHPTFAYYCLASEHPCICDTSEYEYCRASPYDDHHCVCLKNPELNWTYCNAEKHECLCDHPLYAEKCLVEHDST